MIEYFALSGNAAWAAQPTREIMSLFGVAAVPEHDMDMANFLLSHKIIGNNPVIVTSEMQHRMKTGEWVTYIESSSLEPGEDAGGLKRLIKVNVWRLMRAVTGFNPGPWGILRGVRPAKIVHRLLDQEIGSQEINRRLQRLYLLEPEKAALIIGIALRQRQWIASDFAHKKRISVYIGVPFCPSRCLYCSFPAYVLPRQREKTELFLAAFRRDIQSAGALIKQFGLEVQNIYIGGGTPTSLDDEDFAELLSLTVENFKSAATTEFTVEAGRPDSVSDVKISIMRQYGVDRVSVNPQTMQEKTLKRIGRMHTVEDIINIFGKIRQSGIPVINMDIIAGLPGETSADMHETMEKLVALNPENITVHTLALKKGSELKGSQEISKLPDETTVRRMLAVAREFATRAGMAPYYLYRQKYMTGNMENVGYARPGFECVYNIQIMEERQSIIGIGPNAGSKAVYSAEKLTSCYFPKDILVYQQSLDKYIAMRDRLFKELYGSD
ncbi:MAG: coproporphyrinogen dehydrogenase HemZ [Negativicutes bacterium]|nr:coproporphyrinogen dehydrogenase HemZ [Negativicutes bacterium]